MKKTLISLAAICAVAATTPAAAENVSVDYRDLNLASVQGQKSLEIRIDRAARKVCGMDNRVSGTRLRPSDERRCYAQAKKQAKKQVAALIAEERLGG